MKRILTALALSVALPVAAFAQDEVTNLAQDYVDLPEVQRMMEDMFSPGSMLAQFESGLPAGVALSEDQRDRIGTLLSDAMRTLQPEMENVMVSASAKVFTADELRALIDFYSSEHGASVMAKMQPFMQETMSVMMPRIQSQMESVTPQLIEIIQEG